MYDIPANFEVIQQQNCTCVIRQDYKDKIDRLLAPGDARTIKGRAEHPVIRLDTDTFVIIRRYKRGGLAGLVLPDIFLGSGRAGQELVVTEKARAAGAPVPEALGIVIKPVFGYLCRIYIITRQITGATTLYETLLSLKNITDSALLLSQKTKLIKAVSQAVFKLHNAGVWHADLQLRNILINGNTAYLIDFDKAKYYKQLSLAQKVGNLIRINRSLLKLKLFGVTATDKIRFLKEYFGGEWPSAPKENIIKDCIRNANLHQWWWRFFP
ncbi:MAG: hypothetical protein HY762_05470 [Planctomycetes bacterium]|nr:hypothetical protein [Planctomycetota bacterium]